MKAEREEKVKIHRILEIDKMIRSGTFPNATKLGKEFEVSRATIMRDIEFLRDRYEAPLEYDQHRNGYYYSDPTFFIQSVMLSEGELFTVSTIMPLLEQYKNTPLEASFKKIMGKITEMLPDQVSVDSFFMNDEIKFISDPLPEIDETIFNTIFTAIKLHASVDFGYRSISSQEYTKRAFDPYHVVCQKGNWYVCGFCHKANEVRIYALSRMKDLNFVVNEFNQKQTFVEPKDFRVENYIDPSFGIWNNKLPPVKIELLFSKNVNTYILERTWHSTQDCHQNEDGSVYLSFETNQIQETQHWVMQFGSSVKVINPPELRENIKEEARKMLEN
ncbi:MAG: WYL domain-containing protein [Treponema sp.]|nr:WYL domain-containing protein [Treponema sp.]